ncbi:MAG: LacI family DNA-binding transcriptional regulator [Actinomycetota bacterium]
MPRARISDVAAAAGVSVTTVSLVLNDVESRISEETRLRVREAAVAVGYSPSTLARGLRSRRTRTIGLISDVIATTPFAGRMLAGAQDAAREHDHLLFLIDTGGDVDIENDAITALSDHQVDALIYASMWHQVVDPPRRLPRDTVLLDCRTADERFRSVVPDDRLGGAGAVREMLDAGHRRIAFVNADDPAVASGLRYRGYLDALAAAGIEPDPRWHIRTEVSAQGAREATDRLLDLPEDQRPTGIFYFNDRMAVGGYRAAFRRGLEIPRDVSIVGFDDQQFVASEQDPPLTSVALPHYQMGRWAMEVSLGVRAPAEATHLMECPVVRRDSVGPPSQNGLHTT